jgi:predicted anti-sigma-YlaC factor YlaD
MHFGELPAARGEAVAAHVRECAACRALLADVAWVETELLAEPESIPPADGLERVLANIEAVQPARDRREHWVRTAVPCAVAFLAAGLTVQQGGLVALLGFLAVGSILTLALAPVLILESQRRS